MKFTVAQVSDVTTNGNVILKFQNKQTVDLGFAKKTKSETYYMAVLAEDNTAKVGQEVEFNLDDFRVVERPFEHPDEGEIMLKWLHL